MIRQQLLTARPRNPCFLSRAIEIASLSRVFKARPCNDMRLAWLETVRANAAFAYWHHNCYNAVGPLRAVHEGR
jgi:hypothetical protein